MTEQPKGSRNRTTDTDDRRADLDVDLTAVLQRWSIPHEFDREIALLLLDDWPEGQRARAWVAFLDALEKGSTLPLSTVQPGQYAFSSRFREQSIARWLAGEHSRETYFKLNRLLADFYDYRWQLVAESTVDAPGSTYYLEKSLFHHFAYDAAEAFGRFEDLFEKFEWLRASSVCDRLIKIADAFDEKISVEQKAWLSYYQAKLHDIRARSPGSDPQTTARHQLKQRRAFEALLSKLEAHANTAPVDLRLQGMIHVQLGNLALLQGRLPEAADHMSRAAQDFRLVNADEQELAALNNFGLVLMKQRRLQEAVSHYEDLRPRLSSSTSNDSYVMAVLSLNLGNSYAELAAEAEANAAAFEDVEQIAHRAADQFRRALEEFEESGFVYGQALAAAALGRWFLLRGEYGEAIAVLRAALRLLPIDSEERNEVEQWLSVAQNRRTSQPEPEEQLTLPELSDIQRLAMMYQFSRHIYHPHSLLALEHEFSHNLRELEALAIADTSDRTSVERLREALRLLNHGRFEESLFRFNETARLARDQSNVRVELQALSWMPLAWLCKGNSTKSIEAATHSLARAREKDSLEFEMKSAFQLASVLATIDGRVRWQEIKPVLLNGLKIARQVDDVIYELYHLLTLGDCAWKAGERNQGYSWLQDALDRSANDVEQQRFIRASIYQSLSRYMLETGNQADALRYAHMAIEQVHDSGNAFYTTATRLTLIQAEMAHDENEDSFVALEKLSMQARDRGWGGVEQEAQYLRSQIFLRRGRAENAYTASSRALKLARQADLREAEVLCLISLGQALSSLGLIHDARATLVTARRLSQERRYPEHLQQADKVLRGIPLPGATP